MGFTFRFVLVVETIKNLHEPRMLLLLLDDQGTFDVHEKLEDVYEFVQSCLSDETQSFSLICLDTADLSGDDLRKTLLELK